MELVLPPTHVLLRASAKDRDRASLRRALLPRLREVLAHVCLWDPDSAIGDQAFCVLSYNPRRLAKRSPAARPMKAAERVH